MREVQSKRRYLLAFLIGTFIFINGFVLTNIIISVQFDRVSQFQDETSYAIFAEKLNYELFEGDLCSTDSFNKISQDLGYQGASIGDLEEKLGKNNQAVQFRKEFYSIVELEHFEYIKDVNEACDQKFSTILFFYSNRGDDLDKSERAGRLLDLIRERNDNLVVYSFDLNLNSEIIQNLINLYDIEESPTLIINNNKRVSGNIQLEDIEDNLNKFKAKIVSL